jgi:hypothetical protein
MRQRRHTDTPYQHANTSIHQYTYRYASAS